MRCCLRKDARSGPDDALASRDRAHLTGVFPTPSVRSPPGCEEADFELMRERWCRDAEDAIRHARHLFEEMTSRVGVAAGWRPVHEGPEFAKSLSRYVDLAIIGQRTLDAPAGTAVRAEDIVMDIGRPILMVPDGSSTQVGRNVALA